MLCILEISLPLAKISADVKTIILHSEISLDFNCILILNAGG